jgi:hypothetical protein
MNVLVSLTEMHWYTPTGALVSATMNFKLCQPGMQFFKTPVVERLNNNQ